MRKEEITTYFLKYSQNTVKLCKCRIRFSEKYKEVDEDTGFFVVVSVCLFGGRIGRDLKALLPVVEYERECYQDRHHMPITKKPPTAHRPKIRHIANSQSVTNLEFQLFSYSFSLRKRSVRWQSEILLVFFKERIFKGYLKVHNWTLQVISVNFAN